LERLSSGFKNALKQIVLDSLIRAKKKAGSETHASQLTTITALTD
jgi:hypothetical protein